MIKTNEMFAFAKDYPNFASAWAGLAKEQGQGVATKWLFGFLDQKITNKYFTNAI